MRDLESLYLKLPVPLQNVICNLEGWRIQLNRFGNSFLTHLHEAEIRTFWSQEQIRAYRDERLQIFIQHCARTVPYYRRLFKDCCLSPNDIQTLEDLTQLPILTKEKVQDQYPDLISEAVPKHQQIIGHTSGTTGGGLRFATTRQAIQEQWAIWWRYRRWHALQPGTWCGHFGGRSVVPLSQTRPPYWRSNFPGKQVLFSAYHMNYENMDAYIDELQRRRPPWLHGYPSLLALLASYILESGKDIGYEVRWITVGAENLLPQQAEIIERAFGALPIEHYGMAEAVANISECELGTLHVDEDFAAVEFLPNPDGNGHKIIGTNFTNFATPLLRYDVQDIVNFSNLTCSCGRSGRVVAKVDGRLEDYIVLKSGARLGRMDHIFKDMINIKEAQIYQKKPGEIIIRTVRGRKYSDKDERALLHEIQKRVGDDTDIIIQHVKDLERSAVGKLRFVISEIPESQIGRKYL